MNTIYLDFRTREEFVMYPIDNAINIPLEDFFRGDLRELDVLPKNIFIEFYYTPGYLIEYVLREKGFMNIVNLADYEIKITECISSKICLFDQREKIQSPIKFPITC